ncbi:hypothetical protein GcC1_179035 [Golovinomyces cichoracearum]|uniref:BZIP domain-containing protein n=1 Tax=Golovinomyces cichoracearum TaxID=62708 RepID=A0A420HNF1_9PEZI|nr:hypothetical protein GcC1_179035 [Golovinomyces cichoracearum]
MEAFPIYDFPQSPLALETDLVAFSGTVESSFTGRSLLGTFDSGSGLTLPTNSGGGDSSPVQFAPFFSLQSTDYQQHYERSSSLNEESAAFCPGHSQLSLTASTSQLVPTGPPTSGNELKPSALKREWSSMEADKNPTMLKCMRQRSPLIRSHIEISRRGSSVRKRNASCDIPAGHSIKNIDELISQSTDEQEVKELKQQKRLLRNRQAALDSRQRKKLYTEHLEEENKGLIALVSRQQDDLSHAEMRISDHVQKEAHWRQKCEALQREREQIFRQHEIQCSELRNQISVLMSRAELLVPDRISVPPSGSCINSTFIDTDGTRTRED